MKMLFMGRKSYAAEMLAWSVEKGIEVVGVVTDSHFSNSPTMKMAKSLGLSIISLKEAEENFRYNSGYADLVISYLYWEKIKEPLISMPTLGCINFHPAILPDWRGTAGYNIAILNKLTEWGATAHYVDKSIDTGGIIKVFKFNFDFREETAFSLEEKTQKIQQDLYKSTILDVLEKGNLVSIKQSKNEGTYISRKQMEEMKKIDIKKDDIDLKIRAFWFPPYTGAFLQINGKKYTLINSDILKQLAKEGETSNI